MTIAEQIRADWLGLAIALVIWGAATKQLKRVFGIAGLLVCLLLIGFIADIRIPAIAGRGGEISARETIARAVSATNPEIAEEYSSNTGFYRGTVTWRENWWANIREEVSRDISTSLFGLGYGYPIQDGCGQTDIKFKPPDLRTTSFTLPSLIPAPSAWRCSSGCNSVSVGYFG